MAATCAARNCIIIAPTISQPNRDPDRRTHAGPSRAVGGDQLCAVLLGAPDAVAAAHAHLDARSPAAGQRRDRCPAMAPGTARFRSSQAGARPALMRLAAAATAAPGLRLF